MENPAKMKKSLITGATKGIGLAIAKKLASQGYSLLLVSGNKDNLQQVRQALLFENPDIEIEIFAADLRQKEAIHALCNWAEERTPDVLVNNVGLFEPYSLLGEAPDMMETLWNINYLSAHHLCRIIGNQMKSRRSGHIFNIGSTASRSPVQAASYTVTKFAIRGLTYVLREELKDFSVKVTEIVPGSTWTSSWEGTEMSERDFVRAEDIAEALYQCLLLPENSNIDELIIRPQKGNILTGPVE